MGFMSKKKKEPVVVVPEPVKPPVAVEEQKVTANVTKSTNNVLSDTRVTLDAIVAKLEHMKNDTELQDKFRAVTDKYSKAMKQREEDVETFLQELLGIQKKLFLTADDRDNYWNNTIDYYIKLFKEKNSAVTVKIGAYRLNRYALNYINSYEDALIEGRRLKANMCNKMLMYILKRGYHKEDISDPDELETRMKHKEYIVDEKGKDLIKFVDTLYNLYAEHDAMHIRQVHTINRFVEVQDKLGVIPPKIKENIDSIGFKMAIKKFPPSSPERRIYLPVLLHLANMDSTVRCLNIKMEAKNSEIIQLSNEIERLVGEIDELMSITGTVMSHEEYNRKINALNTKINNDIATMQNNVVANAEREAKFNSMLNSFEQNLRVVESGAVNLSIVERSTIKKNEMDNLAAQIKARSEELKRQQEEEQKNNPVIVHLNDPNQQEMEAMLN